MFPSSISLGTDHTLADVTFLALLRAFGVLAVLIINFKNLRPYSLPISVESVSIECLEAPKSDEYFLGYIFWLFLKHSVHFVFELFDINQLLPQRFCRMLPHHGHLWFKVFHEKFTFMKFERLVAAVELKIRDRLLSGSFEFLYLLG